MGKGRSVDEESSLSVTSPPASVISSSSSKTRSTDCTPPEAFSAIPLSPMARNSDNSYPHREKNCLEHPRYSTRCPVRDDTEHDQVEGLCFHFVDNNIHNTKTFSWNGGPGTGLTGGISMANPSPGNSITLRVAAPSSFTATSELAAAVGAAGAAITALGRHRVPPRDPRRRRHLQHHRRRPRRAASRTP